MKPESFAIINNEIPATVEELSIAAQTIYRVIFTDKTAPLILTRATNHNAGRFWTSIPEGRQEFAEEIGKLIEKHIRQKV
jgi:hypothetical protein